MPSRSMLAPRRRCCQRLSVAPRPPRATVPCLEVRCTRCSVLCWLAPRLRGTASSSGPGRLSTGHHEPARQPAAGAKGALKGANFMMQWAAMPALQRRRAMRWSIGARFGRRPATHHSLRAEYTTYHTVENDAMSPESAVSQIRSRCRRCLSASRTGIEQTRHTTCSSTA